MALAATTQWEVRNGGSDTANSGAFDPGQTAGMFPLKDGILDSMARAATYYVYALVNILNGRTYIGQTKRLSARKRQHRSDLNLGKHSNDHLQKAWRKYGEESFDFMVISEHSRPEGCERAEAFYVQWFRTIGLSYNIRVGGNPVALSDSTRAKIRKSWATRAPMTDETKARISESLMGHVPWNKGKSTPGHPQSEETKEKIRQAHLGKTLPDATKQKIREALLGEKNPWFGRKHTEETKRKIGDKNRINSLGNTSRLGTGRKKDGGK